LQVLNQYDQTSGGVFAPPEPSLLHFTIFLAIYQRFSLFRLVFRQLITGKLQEKANKFRKIDFRQALIAAAQAARCTFFFAQSVVSLSSIGD